MMKNKSDWRLFVRLWSYLSPYSWSIFFSFILMILSKIIEAYVPLSIGRISQEILTDATSSFPLIVQQSLTIVGFICLAYFLDTINVIIKNRVGQQALYKLRFSIYRHLQKMPIGYFNQQRIGTLMTRTIHDVDQINQLFAEGIVPIIGSILLFVSIAFWMLVADWRLGFIFIIIFPSVLWMVNTFRKNQRRCFDKIRQVVAQMNAFVQEHLLGASTIRSFGLHEEQKKRFEELNEVHRQSNIETIHHYALFFARIDFVQSFSLISVFALLAVLANAGYEEFQGGLYVTFSLYILMLFRPLGDLADRYNMLQSAFAAAERIFELLDRPQETEEGTLPLSHIEHIAFKNVWFAYQSEDWILKGLSFEVRRGESVALVGMTGAGKTTVLNLLLRFYTHQKGAIEINGKEIHLYSLEALRGQFSVVLQDPEIFSGSIKENITLGDPKISDEKIAKVCQDLHLTYLLTKFSDGVDHSLPERGKNLSLGERQLISLARAAAHYRSCLLLDEATANIDLPSEKRIQTALKTVLEGRIAFVVAHRLSTIQDVQKIMVLYEGQIYEEGRHDELLKAKGMYEKLYRLQFAKG
jgi:ATP-binding cassette subfamily B multidrug efflux pump